MRKFQTFIFALCCFALSGQSKAQTAEQILQAAINAEGRECPLVTTYKVLGKTRKGSGFFATACSDGGTHVVELKPDKTLNYVSSCLTFEVVAKKRCFE